MSNLVWLQKFIRPKRWLLVLAVILCILDMFALLGITGIQKWIIDDVIINKQFHLLHVYLILFALVILVYNLVHLVSFMLNRSNEFSIQKLLSIKLMEYLYQIKVGKFNNQRIGGISQLFNDDIGNTSQLVAQILPFGVMNIVQVLILALFIGFVNPFLLLLIFGLSVVLIISGKYYGPKSKILSKELQAAKAEVLIQIEEGIASTKEIIAFDRLDWEQKKYNQTFKRFFNKVMLEAKLQNKQTILNVPLQWGINLGVLGYGAYLTLKGDMSVGTYVVVYQFSSQLIDGIHRSYDFLINISSRTSSIERLREFVDQQTESREGKYIEGDIHSIQFQNVSFRYTNEAEDILTKLCLEIPIGKKIAFVGSSGGGKSTIAHLLERFFDPTEGEIRVNGISIQNLSLESWRDRMSLVAQNPYFFPDTIRNNLIMGRAHINEEDMVAACKAAEIHDSIVKLRDGYDTLLGERGFTFSGGQRLRLAIARSLITDPEILILDEATSALDLEIERRVQKNLDLIRQNKTTIFIAHRLSTIENSDIIFVLDKGKVIEKGTHEELLFSKSFYRDLIVAKQN